MTLAPSLLPLPRLTIVRVPSRQSEDSRTYLNLLMQLIQRRALEATPLELLLVPIRYSCHVNASQRSKFLTAL